MKCRRRGAILLKWHRVQERVGREIRGGIHVILNRKGDVGAEGISGGQSREVLEILLGEGLGRPEEVEITEDDDVIRSVEAFVIEEVFDALELDGAPEEIIGFKAAFQVECDDHGVEIGAGDIDNGGSVSAGDVLCSGGGSYTVGAEERVFRDEDDGIRGVEFDTGGREDVGVAERGSELGEEGVEFAVFHFLEGDDVGIDTSEDIDDGIVVIECGVRFIADSKMNVEGSYADFGSVQGGEKEGENE